MNEHSHADHAHTHVDFDSPEMVAHAELEGEVMSGLVTQAVSALAEQCERYDVHVARVLDLGCGPGIGTCCLAQQFDSARVAAVDGSATMLAHATARAERLGLAQRVETQLVQFPADLRTLGRADIAWASMVLHHIGDEAAALREIRELLEPGGLLALVERAGPVRILPENVELGRPGIWERLDEAWAAWFTDMRADLAGTTTSAAYPAMLAQAGFEVAVDEVLTLVLDAPLNSQARRWAHQHLLSTRSALEHRADPADLEALDVLVDENTDQSILNRDDTKLRATRLLCVGRAIPDGESARP